MVDGRGHIYVNSIQFGFIAGEPPTSGIIALVTPDGTARQVAGDLAFPNGMVVTPENATLIVSESFTGRLIAFDIAADGRLSKVIRARLLRVAMPPSTVWMMYYVAVDGRRVRRRVSRILEWGVHPIEEDVVKPRIKVLTLGVDDLERSLAFYRDGLGLATDGIVGQEYAYGAVAFFTLQDGLILALWPRTSIARDTGLSSQPPSATEFTIGHNVGSTEEVDAVMEQAERAGARIVKAAGETFWGGYAGYFQDPDGHVWEILWNPQLADS